MKNLRQPFYTMRIASLAPSNTEIVYALEKEDSLVATTSLCDYPPEAREKESVGGWTSGIDLEKLESLEPDIVLTSDQLQQEIRDSIDFAPVLHVEPGTLEEVYESIIEIGEEVGAADEARELVEDMRTSIEKIQAEGSPRVYCEEWGDPPYVSGNWIPGLLEKAGIQYPIEDGERSREIDLEELKDFDPDQIFLNICGAGVNAERDKVLERRSWDQLEAVRKGRVHVIDDSLLNRPGPRIVEGLRRIVDHLDH
jgi:iron complex transport system substrate-binding protein